MQHKKFINSKTFALLLLVGFTATVMILPAYKANGALNAVGISCPAEVRIGNTLSCKLTGLTVGSNYLVIAAHSDGNTSKVVTAITATEYARFVFTSADSNNIVPIHIDAASSAGASQAIDAPTNNATTHATTLVNLVSPVSDVPSSFFQLLLAPMLIIGVFILLMGAFFYKKKMSA